MTTSLRRPAPQGTRAAPRPWPVACLSLAILAQASGARCQEAPAQDLASARAMLERWVETRRLISAEKRDWALDQEMLVDRIALLEQQIATLRTSIAEADAGIGAADTTRLELVRRNEELSASSARLVTAVAPLEQRTRELLVRLPDPIRTRVEPLSRRIPAPGAGEPPSLGERFQNVVGVLNEVDKFHREVTLTSEMRTLGSGAVAEVTAIYAGLGHGWYVTAKGDAAGVGVPGPQNPGHDGWVWTAADAAAVRVARVAAILRNEETPAFVALPVRIQ